MKRINMLLSSCDYIIQEAELLTVWSEMPEPAKIDFQTSYYAIFLSNFENKSDFRNQRLQVHQKKNFETNGKT